ncbi:MAG: YhbY family RNA-binding protein [Patescibacteria group bacterium]|nr:YhbY family RNA-binding protein [Patescibacteria group bacterium]
MTEDNNDSNPRFVDSTGISNFDKKRLKVKGRGLSPFTSIGKNGISDNTILQIKTNLKAHKLCKIKILRTFLDESGRDKKEVAEDLAKRTGSVFIELMGLTVTLYKR